MAFLEECEQKVAITVEEKLQCLYGKDSFCHLLSGSLYLLSTITIILLPQDSNSRNLFSIDISPLFHWLRQLEVTWITFSERKQPESDQTFFSLMEHLKANQQKNILNIWLVSSYVLNFVGLLNYRDCKRRHYINPMWTYGIFFPFWDCRLNLCNPVNKMSLVVWGVVLNDSCQSSLGTTLKGHLDTPVTDRLDIVWRGLCSSCKKASWGGNEDFLKKTEEIRYSFSSPWSLEQMILLLRYELCVWS